MRKFDLDGGRATQHADFRHLIQHLYVLLELYRPGNASSIFFSVFIFYLFVFSMFFILSFFVIETLQAFDRQLDFALINI